MQSEAGKTHKVHLTKVQETLLITLYARAMDYRSKSSILNDEKADNLVGMIDYDFGKLTTFGKGLLVVRAKQYDEWLKEFLAINPAAVVLNLGCGLDTRITRINPPAGVSWFDIDYPEVIKLRENFFSNRDGYRMIGSPLTDLSWLSKIPGGRPAIMIADGVLEYLTEQEVRDLLGRVTDYFPHGQLAFDVMSRFAVRSAGTELHDASGPLHKWAVGDLNEVDELDAKITRIAGFSLFRSQYIRELSWGLRWLYGLMSLVPQSKNMLRLVRYEF